MADHIAVILRAAVMRRGRASLAVPGGDTPALLFDALARRDAYWRKVSITLVDERWANSRDPASNELLARRRLLQAQARAARFVPLKTGHATPHAGRSLAAARLKPLLPLDVCVLGVGEDGHIASLFPGANLEARAGLVAVDAPGARGRAARLSISFKEIARARSIILLLRGQGKRTALASHLAPSAALTPIEALTRARHGRIWTSWAP